MVSNLIAAFIAGAVVALLCVVAGAWIGYRLKDNRSPMPPLKSDKAGITLDEDSRPKNRYEGYKL